MRQPGQEPAACAAPATAPSPAPAGKEPPVLVVHDLHKRFGPRELLVGLTLEVHSGERLVLLGESGSGKSTLLNVIAGLEPADRGLVRIAGERVDANDADASAALRRRRVGFVFQAFHLLPHLDASGNVMVPLLLLGCGWREARERARAQLDALGMGEHLRARPASLSGGEQQRVAIARALVHRPALLLADEPTGNLDEDNAARVLELLRQACGRQGTALLLVTHSQQAAAIGSRILRLQHARLQAA